MWLAVQWPLNHKRPFYNGGAFINFAGFRRFPEDVLFYIEVSFWSFLESLRGVMVTTS